MSTKKPFVPMLVAVLTVVRIRGSVDAPASDGREGNIMQSKRAALSLAVCTLAVTCFAGCTHTLSVATDGDSLRIAMSQQLGNCNQTCAKCGSTRKVRGTIENGRIRIAQPEVATVLYRSAGFKSCTHQWKDGIDTDVHGQVSDGSIVLVRKGSSYGALVLRRQAGPRTEYTWYYRSDNKGTFGTADGAHFKTGKSVLATGACARLMFGPFGLTWSRRASGKGVLMYEYCAGETVGRDGLRICLTDEKDIQKIDAADAKWLYKGTTIDPGLPGGQMEQGSVNSPERGSHRQ